MIKPSHPSFLFIMLVACLLLLLSLSENEAEILPKNDKDNAGNVIQCVKDILKMYYEKGSQLTNVDMNYKDTKLLEAINSMCFVSMVIRKADSHFEIPNEGYLITAGNTSDFIQNFRFLINEASWKPSKKFIIVIELLHENKLRDIFNELLKVHVVNAIVISKNGDIYSYNPFENYACGRYFERIISYGSCHNPTVDNLFPNKLVTGLRNCTFRATVPHIPPYTIKPKHRNSSVQGSEQYAFQIMADLEQFKINYTYSDFAEKVSIIDENMTAKGSFLVIQKNQSDALFGFTMLTNTRADAFDVLYGHLAYTDELKIVVRKAGFVPTWKNIYLEFNSTVWVLLGISFIACAFFITILSRSDDKISIVFKMLDCLLLHGFSMRCKFAVKMVIIVWVWFAYLMNSFYQSSLVSLTTNPIKEFQVSTEQDLVKFQFEPCVSYAMRTFLSSVSNLTFEYNHDCQLMLQSIDTVGNTDGLYSVVPESIFNYDRHLFYDKSGKIKIHDFAKPINKIIYGIFLYKGFPNVEKLRDYSFRISESGLMKRYNALLYYYQRKYHRVEVDSSFKARLVVPWVVLAIGAIIATASFVLEVFGYNYSPLVKK